MRSKEADPRPLYDRIKSHLFAEIEGGRLKPGERVPSERELTDRFGVSRMTARQALTELEDLGLLHRVQGRGSFVADPKLEHPATLLTSFTEEMRLRGVRPGARVIRLEQAAAGAVAGRALSMEPEERVIRLSRLRTAGAEPVALEVSHLPADRFGALLGLDLTDLSLWQVLFERWGVRLSRAHHTLEAVAAGPADAALLQVREGAPLLRVAGVAFDAAERPTEYVESLYRGDRYRFATELRSPLP